MSYVLALVLGAVYCLGFAPFDYWPLTCVALAGLFWLLHRVPGKPVLVAWWFGVGKYGIGASWVYVSINVFGDAPPPLAALLVVLFVALLAVLFSAPAGWVYGKLRPARAWSSADILLFASAWVFMDWVSTWLFTGFPWLLPGYAFMDTPMLAAAPVVGVLGMGLMVNVSLAALVALIVRQHLRVRMVLWCVGPWLLVLAMTQVQWVEPLREYKVALVQGNTDQARKWLPEQAAPIVRKHMDLSAAHWDADLLVWPEASVTLYLQQAEGLLENLNHQGRATNTNVVLGIPAVEALPTGGYQFQNLAIGLGAARGRFAKHHLVPFGEYVPFEGLLRGLITFFDLPMSVSTPGAKYQPNLQLSFGQAAMAICYEIAYPESMRARSASAALLMTISNDTWFGDSIGPPQHMQMARMRAVENGRWLVRATNNGVTGIVDYAGNVTGVLPQFEAGVLRGQVSTVSGRTPFSFVGHWPVLMTIAVVFVGMGWRKWRREFD